MLRILLQTQRKTFFQDKNTGEQSIREVDEFIIHPNKFKSELGTGDAIMVAPVFSGTQTVEFQFKMFPDKSTDKKSFQKSTSRSFKPIPLPKPSQNYHL